MGYDGIIHTGGLSAKWNPDVKKPYMVAIAFAPQQVKSAIGNDNLGFRVALIAVR